VVEHFFLLENRMYFSKSEFMIFSLFEVPLDVAPLEVKTTRTVDAAGC